jgi:7-cyano-7-deazaguanine reductase
MLDGDWSSDVCSSDLSLKLYFNSFAQTTFASLEEVQAAMTRDLSAAAGASVAVFLWEVSTLPERPLNNFSGTLLDDLDIETRAYRPAPELLKADTGDAQVEEQLVSHLLRSNCPVTGQPDWASVCIHYRGPTIDHAGLLAYIVSFRQHSDFHEHCVERIFVDVWAQCRPTFLSVYARYTRRGGIDINPFRSSAPEPDPENGGDIRQ